MVETRMHLQKPVRLAVTSALLLGLSTASSMSATTTSTFTVQMTIGAACAINSASTMDFGSTGALTANIDATSSISVTCSTSTPYNIGLSVGVGSGATLASRKMTNGANTINYTLYRESARTSVWGTTIGTDTVSATGNGTAQAHTVYGRVPAQTTPVPASYTDTITVTVTY